MNYRCRPCGAPSYMARWAVDGEPVCWECMVMFLVARTGCARLAVDLEVLAP